MQWALVNTIPMEREVAKWEIVNGKKTFIRETFTEEIDTIMNFIVYDGIAKYTPPNNYRLVQVQDDALVGDKVDPE